MSAHTPCHMIKDLLPLYLDDLVSEESGTAIEQHLKSCSDCHEYYEHMKSELLEEQAQKQTETQREINYLKKIKQHTTKKLILETVLTLSACILAFAVKLFVIGSPADTYHTTYLNVDKDTIQVGGTLAGSAQVFSHYKLKGTKNGSELILYTCLPSPWNKSGSFHLELPKNKIQGTLSINKMTVKEDGTIISAMANQLFQNKHPYIGDATANARLSQCLGMGNELGNFTNELQTETTPYGWTLYFENSTNNSAIFDEKMKGFSCILLALVDNLGEVSWEYTLELADGPVTRTKTMTEADCSAYLGSPVKNFSKSPEDVQELLDILKRQCGLSFHSFE